MSHVRASFAVRLLVASFVLLFASLPATAQPTGSSGELAAIEKALLRIATVLERQNEQTHATLLLSRLEIENRDLRSLDDVVAKNRSSLRQLALEEQQLIDAIEQERRLMDRDTASQEERLQVMRQLEMGEARLEGLTAERSDLEQRVIELENEAHDAALRRDALRAEIDELLELDPR